MRFVRTRANGVSLWARAVFPPTMSATRIFRTSSASAINDRWQRHRTASAHMSTVFFVAANLIAVQSRLEFRGLYVIRIAAERSVTPAHVHRIGLGAATPA
jgi:hypothetical protein